MPLVNAVDYRLRLKDELEQRCQHNPRYSLRSFARDLGLSPGRLSEILRGRCGLSPHTAARIAKRLGWSSEESKQFVDRVEAKHARSPLRRQIASKRLIKYGIPPQQQLHEDALRVIKDWYHLAILELLTVQGAKSDASWIADALEITEMEARFAIDRLLRLKQLKREGKRLVPAEPVTATTDGIPSQSIRHFQKQILEKAIAALHLQHVDERNITATIMAFDSKQMDEAKAQMKSFRFAFNQDFGTSDSSDGVYCLSMQLFRLSSGLVLKNERDSK